VSFKELSVAQFHVLLLTVLFVGLLCFVLHMSHHGMDKDLISWGRESAGTVLGGLLYAITGRNNTNGASKQ
jgi:hypothetical protein